MDIMEQLYNRYLAGNAFIIARHYGRCGEKALKFKVPKDGCQYNSLTKEIVCARKDESAFSYRHPLFNDSVELRFDDCMLYDGGAPHHQSLHLLISPKAQKALTEYFERHCRKNPQSEEFMAAMRDAQRYGPKRSPQDRKDALLRAKESLADKRGEPLIHIPSMLKKSQFTPGQRKFIIGCLKNGLEHAPDSSPYEESKFLHDGILLFANDFQILGDDELWVAGKSAQSLARYFKAHKVTDDHIIEQEREWHRRLARPGKPRSEIER
jgi:hypothetical protein